MKKIKKFNQRIQLSIRNFKIIIVAISLAMVGLTSCGGGDDSVSAATKCGSGNYALEFEDDINKFIEASTNYSNNPTKENCEKYKKAGSNYVTVLKGYVKCIPSSGKIGYDQALKDLQTEINNINCN